MGEPCPDKPKRRSPVCWRSRSSTRKALERASKKKGVSKSEYIERAVRKALREEGEL